MGWLVLGLQYEYLLCLLIILHALLIQVGNCDAVLWFWATYEAAQYCLLARLRTPLGMPADTFTALESECTATFRMQGDSFLTVAETSQGILH